jgi:histidinol-phosphatase (PHP family)
MLSDYHTHTEFSYDCNVPMERQCQAAIDAGVAEIAFTEHEENNPNEEAPNSFRHADYMAEVERCRARFAGQLTIRAGIEISEPHHYPDQVERVLAAHPWDFVLGSLHWVDEQTNALRPEFFTQYGGWRQAFQAYFREMLAMAQRGDFDVLAHLDYPARYVRLPAGQSYDIRDFEPDIRPVLRALIDRGKGIEINTASLRRGLPNPCPPACVVDWFGEMGGRLVTLGSDAHRPQDIGAHLGLALDMARQAGIAWPASYHRRQPRHGG